MTNISRGTPGETSFLAQFSQIFSLTLGDMALKSLNGTKIERDKSSTGHRDKNRVFKMPFRVPANTMLRGLKQYSNRAHASH